jgi:hypothetical protein
MITLRRMGWAEHVARIEINEQCILNFGQRTYQEDKFWNPMRRWENNIEMDVDEPLK